MSDFLENLKKAADSGEFNSEAAKKITEITELADSKIGKRIPEEGETLKNIVEGDLENLQKNLEERQKDVINKPVTEDEAIRANTEYEEKMRKLKLFDAINKQHATLIDIDDMVTQSIQDMQDFMRELDTKFEKEFESNNPMFDALKTQMVTIKNKYDSIIKYEKIL